MRLLVLILVACASGFADLLDTSATCNGVTYSGTDSASCGAGTYASASAEANLAGLYVTVWVTSYTGYTSAASASLTGDYVLTVMGGSGDGFAEPQLYAAGGNEGAEAVGWSQESLGNSSGGCEVDGPNEGFPYSTCTPTSLPFVSGIPQTLDLSMYADATSGPGYPDNGVGSGAGGVGFVFYDVNGQPLSGVTYTFTPTPEPGMFPLLAAMACAALIARKRLRKSRPGR